MGSGQCLEPYAVAENYLKIDRGMSNEAQSGEKLPNVETIDRLQ